MMNLPRLTSTLRSFEDSNEDERSQSDDSTIEFDRSLTILTDHVKELIGAGPAPSDERTIEVIKTLTSFLIGLLHRRGLYYQPPIYLGILGNSWADDDAMRDLSHTFYCHLFVERLPSLSRHVKQGRSIEALARTQASFFISKLQRRHDPIGYLVYIRLRRSIDKLCESGEVSAKGQKRRTYPVNSDLFQIHRPPFKQRRPQVLEDCVKEWCYSLALALVSSNNRQVANSVENLADCIAELREYGIDEFRFGDLANAMKKYVRPLIESIIAIPVINCPRFEDPEEFLSLIGRIDDAIDKIEPQDERIYMAQLWTIIREAAFNSSDGSRPPIVKIAQRMGIGRNRVSRFLNKLKDLVKKCIKDIDDV